jgi:NADPH2:quinone reductase
MKTVIIQAHGGPEQLKLHEASSPVPGPRETLVKLAAAGVNFMDTAESEALAERRGERPGSARAASNETG